MARDKGYGQFCPVAMAAEILAERWTPLVVRELLCGSMRFNDLQRGLPRMSSALLSKRLKELEHSGIVDRRPAPEGRGSIYRLTQPGQELLPILLDMGNWAQRWRRDELVDDDKLDPDLLMWDMRRRVDKSPIPNDRRFVIQFQFAGMPANRRLYWLMFERGEIDVCVKHPGFDIDIFVNCPMRTIARIWLGHESMDAALRRGELQLDGTPRDIKLFKASLELSIFAEAGREPPGQTAPA
jgi:DNA-binding HxlR family transcriptional regulator